MTINAPGIYDISFDDYLSDPCPEPSLSSGIAHTLCASTPAHAKQRHPRLCAQVCDEDEENFDIGKLAHAIVLEGVNKVEVLLFDNYRTNKAKAARDEARKAGRIPLLAKVWADVEAMVNAFRDQLDSNKDGRAMFRDGAPEQTIIWQEDNGVWCRARPDFLRGVACDDYKTTRATANPESLSRSIFANGWDIQSAFYRRGLKAVLGGTWEFRFAVQECFKPYALSVVALGPQADDLAEKKIRHAIDLWGRCLAADDWPSYPDRTAYVTLPPWIEAAWLEKEENELAQGATA